jgi:transcriptional regulator with XRE-family HTH domain
MSNVGPDRVLRRQFGQRIRELRRERGYSQERFAALSGLDRSYMGSVERGERNIGIDNVGAIARALNVDVSTLFEFSASPNRF